MLTGEYDEYGYIIYQDGVEIYQAGNSPYDSAQEVGLDDALSLDTLKEYCWLTMDELSKELVEEIGTIERI